MEALRPMPFLQQLVGSKVIIKSKWGPHYIGLLVSTDNFMNLQLTECEEIMENSKESTQLQEVLIRCNNVLHIRAATD